MPFSTKLLTRITGGRWFFRHGRNPAPIQEVKGKIVPDKSKLKTYRKWRKRVKTKISKRFKR